MAFDGTEVPSPDERAPSPGALLSAELDRFGRDPVYEEAVRAASLEHVEHGR